MSDTSPERLEFSEDDRAYLEACSRIDTDEDGVDYLDGFPLPPNNDELWSTKPLRMIITELWQDNGRPAYRQREDSIVPQTTNAEVRESNIQSIAKGFGLIQMSDGESTFIGLSEIEPKPTFMEKFKAFIGSIAVKLS